MLIERQQHPFIYLLPAIFSTLVAWLAFLIIGQTPLIRATGLALVITGVTLTLRQWGTIQSIIGGLALAFSPVFWSQATITATDSPATIVLALVAAFVAVTFLFLLVRRPYLAIGIGLSIFAVIFWSQIGTPRSLRLTSLLVAWMMFLLVDAIRISNPRPDEPNDLTIDSQHTWGMLIIFTVGVLNDPLFVLFAPALAMGLWLSRAALPWWYWLTLLAMSVIGIRGMAITYVDAEWWGYSALVATEEGVVVPYILAGGWWQGVRWVDLLGIFVRQFTIVGAFLSIFGLARMARWYPLLGVVTMIAFGVYAVFGLVYFGSDREVLLLPLFIIQVIWLTYAIHAIGQWVDRSFAPRTHIAHRWITAAYVLLPAYLLITNLA